MLLKTWLWACAGGDSDSVALDAGDLDGDGWREEDCDDQDAAIHPDAPDAWYDGLDSDCDGADDWDQDQDGARAEPWGADCDDLDAAVGPAVAELCDGLDQDCDGEATKTRSTRRPAGPTPTATAGARTPSSPAPKG